MDLWGQALWDYHQGNRQHPLILETSYGVPEEVPLEEFYRHELTFNKLELYALELCQGTVLDIGAGAGAHSLALQRLGISTTALESSMGACKVMRARGVKQVVEADFWHFDAPQYHTLLLLMNGAGIGGNFQRLTEFLELLISWLKPEGQILLDSCDVRYLFDGMEEAHPDYYGNLTYCYQYRQQKGTPFPWLFVDYKSLKKVAQHCGLYTQMLYQNGEHYLAKLSRI